MATDWRRSTMTDRPRHDRTPDVPDPSDRPGLEKDPEDWVTGSEPMTGAQASYLGTLARRTGEDVPDDLTKSWRPSARAGRVTPGELRRPAVPSVANVSR